MDENTTQVNEASETGMDEGMSEAQEREFEAALDDQETEETSGDQEENEAAPEAEREAEQQSAKESKKEEKISVGGREYTPAQLEQLFERMSELQGMVNTPPKERALIEKLAAQTGMDVDAFMQQAEASVLEGQISSRMQQLMEQGLESGMARHVAELEVRKKALENEQAMTQARAGGAADEAQRRKAIFDAQVREFEQRFPDVKEPPDEVFEEMRTTGASPVVAYQNYLLQQKERELLQARQAQKNREQTTGNVKGQNIEPEDPFVAELMK